VPEADVPAPDEPPPPPVSRSEITPTGERVDAPLRLDGLYPRVSNMLGGYLIGDDSLEFEIDEVVASQGAGRARLVLDELRRLLTDPTVTDDELDTFVDRTTAWLIENGRTTVAHVADRLAQTLGRSDATE
jgi:hypothetical protein